MDLNAEGMKVLHKLFCSSAFDFTAGVTERDCCTSPELLYGFL